MRLAFMLSLIVTAATFAEPSIMPTPPSSQPSEPAKSVLPLEIKPNDPKLYWIGRFDLSKPEGPRAQWPLSSVTIRFNGTDLQAKLADGGKDFHAVIVDGEPKSVVVPKKGPAAVYDLARNLPPGEHTVQLVKRSESYTGTVHYLGFYLNEGATLLEPKKLSRRIEIIGDSISCGYGNDILDPKQKYSAHTQNAYNTYGAMAGRALDAEVRILAWSGRKVTNTLDIYTKSLPADPKNTWAGDNWKADVVLINLGTNDFSKEVPDEEKWVAAYKALIAQVRKYHGDVPIYLSCGPMFTVGEKGKGLTFQNYLNRIQKELADAGDKSIKQLHFARQDPKQDGVGADWHPSASTHAKMAEKLIAQLKEDLKW